MKEELSEVVADVPVDQIESEGSGEVDVAKRGRKLGF